MLASGIPRRVFFEPRYDTSIFQVFMKLLPIVRLRCCEYPEPLVRSTPKTPWPKPEFELGDVTCTVGPLDKLNAALMLSSDCCPTVWMKGNCGNVNGVVMPDCSK